MLNRKTIAAIALIATGASGAALADDGDVRRARQLLEQAQSFGKPSITGQSAGETRRDGRDSTVTSASEMRWEEILKKQGRN